MRNSIAFLSLTLMLIATTFSPAESVSPSPAETSIAQARKAIAAKPERAEAYNSLAVAFLRRARETSDASYIQQADKAVQRALQLAPDNFESQRTQVSVLLEKHEYPKALDQAKALNSKIADDIMVYGLLTQANAELGNYDQAEKAAQWMLNLRPGNAPALLNTAYLRELFGDPDGAYEVLDLALQSTAPNETEESAWILTRMAHMRLISGNVEAADHLLHGALDAFPGYRAALEGLAQVRVAQKRDDEAIILLKQCEQALPRAVDLYHLAETLQLAGRADDAEKAFTEFQERAEGEAARKDSANRELIFYYADQAHQPSKALQLAKQEVAWRHDVYTLDAYAWALHVNGQDREARNQIDIALAVGIRDAKLFRHAGEIALKLRDLAVAERDLKQSVEMNTADSEQARVTLANLSQVGRR
jgi:tetratricopeptide (TPR) repeat protein